MEYVTCTNCSLQNKMSDGFNHKSTNRQLAASCGILPAK